VRARERKRERGCSHIGHNNETSLRTHRASSISSAEVTFRGGTLYREPGK
jgi:hypothetical protein